MPKYVEELRSQAVDSFLSEFVELPSDSSLAKVIGLLRERGVYEVFLPERLGSKSMKPDVRGIFDFKVKDAMESTPLSCSPDTSVQKALDSMMAANRTYILVTRWEELQGIATHRDFMSLLVEAQAEPDVPVFIVGLPDEPFEAEATKVEFKRTVNQLRRVFPDILEARSVIKSRFSRPGKERGRYEVTVQIRTAKNSYTYSEEGWELPIVYDLITDRLKRLMTQKQRPRRQLQREKSELV